jgi:hypothetical protein
VAGAKRQPARGKGQAWQLSATGKFFLLLDKSDENVRNAGLPCKLCRAASGNRSGKVLSAAGPAERTERMARMADAWRRLPRWCPKGGNVN